YHSVIYYLFAVEQTLVISFYNPSYVKKHHHLREEKYIVLETSCKHPSLDLNKERLKMLQTRLLKVLVACALLFVLRPYLTICNRVNLTFSQSDRAILHERYWLLT